jgi:DNA invertase Pin-like site-specific DNA recombinase
MNQSNKVQPHHLENAAYLYIRQSSMRQVVENVESTQRQYALRGRAIALGWREDQIIVVDSDQGESGASAAWRQGFQRLVSEVGMGRAGIVMGLEVSRLARNNADWHRLLEICALADTLILDEDGVYDPSNFNDRLLLGLKGAMSEAELHVLKARLRGGVLNKVKRGEYQCTLPTGFVYDAAGDVVFDPDSQIRETIAHFFQTFARVGSACQTVKVFRKEGILFPSRRNLREATIFCPLTASTAMRVLTNPRYAGAYAYGRRRYRRAADGKHKIQRKRESGEWLACIPGAHRGYITWEQYQQNLKILESNGHGYEIARASPPREGAALLQGRAVCGRCGRHFRARYAARRGRLDVWYVCDRASAKEGAESCQTIAGGPIDAAIGALVAEKMTPAAIELALEIRREIEARHEEADRLRSRAVERAQIAADLAQRRFMMVDPNNRLVADTLEGEWNESLRTLATAREDRERSRQDDRLILDKAIHSRLLAMTTDFQTVWTDSQTPNRERKRLLAYLVEDVTLIKHPEEGTTTIHVRFKGGKVQTLTTQNPKSSAQMVKATPEVIALVDKFLDELTYPEIAERLNARGFRPGGSVRLGKGEARFTALRVSYLVNAYGLRPRFERLRARGLLTKQEAAARLKIHVATLISWAKHGIVTRYAYNAHAYLYDLSDLKSLAKHSSRWDRLVDRVAAAKKAKRA